MSATPARRAVVTAGIAALIGFVVAAALGAWQVQRLVWKQDVIARIEARVHGDPQRPDVVYQQVLRREDVEYTRVEVFGHFDHDRELHVYWPGPAGPGWQLLTPFYASNGAVFYVNRGYVPADRLEQAQRPVDQVEVVGLLRSYDRRSAFTPDNDPAANTWYWYDFDAMNQHILDTWQRRNRLVLYPYVIEAEGSPDGSPAGGATRLEIPNDHLLYAITWFGLALTLAGVYGVWARQQLKRH